MKYENNFFLFRINASRRITLNILFFLLEPSLFKKMFNPNRFVIFPDNIPTKELQLPPVIVNELHEVSGSSR